MMDKEDFYWYWICNIRGIGNGKIRILLDTFETPQAVYHADRGLLEKINGLKKSEIDTLLEMVRSSQMYEDYCSLEEKRIHFTHPGKKDYPVQLMDIYDKPYALYYKGRLPQKERPVVSIIGARACTEYGRLQATHFGRTFGQMGIQVVSGMALGIDAAGHRGALQANGYTLAVLGCGVDVCYPRENIELYTRIVETGGIMSEYPPGTVPLQGQFPMRNRLISGLSDVVVVVEARRKSGSLITVDQALEQNKDIMAVPGRIGDSLSEGCNRLLQMGAQMILEPQDIFSNKRIAQLCDKNSFIDNHKMPRCDNENFGYENVEKSGKTHSGKNIEIDNFEKSGLASKKNMLYSCVDLYPKSMNIIIEETKLTIPEVSRLLLELELEGLVKEISKGCFVRMHL